MSQPDEFEVRSDPFQPEQVGEAPAIQVTPEELALDEEKSAPDTEPAPPPHPDTLSEAHGFPRARRVQE